MEQYLTAKRINSLKQYLTDCKNMPYNEAWNAHKARMQEPGQIDVMIDDLATIELGEQYGKAIQAHRKELSNTTWKAVIDVETKMHNYGLLNAETYNE
jgi:hypothetical protein